MAVTLSIEELRDAIRAGDSTEETVTVTRLIGVASALVLKYSPGAPDAVHDEAAVRVAGYLFDAPSAPNAVANAMRNSGAYAMLMPWRIHRAGSTAEASNA